MGTVNCSMLCACGRRNQGRRQASLPVTFSFWTRSTLIQPKADVQPGQAARIQFGRGRTLFKDKGEAKDFHS